MDKTSRQTLSKHKWYTNGQQVHEKMYIIIITQERNVHKNHHEIIIHTHK